MEVSWPPYRSDGVSNPCCPTSCNKEKAVRARSKSVHRLGATTSMTTTTSTWHLPVYAASAERSLFGFLGRQLPTERRAFLSGFLFLSAYIFTAYNANLITHGGNLSAQLLVGMRVSVRDGREPLKWKPLKLAFLRFSWNADEKRPVVEARGPFKMENEKGVIWVNVCWSTIFLRPLLQTFATDLFAFFNFEPLIRQNDALA